MSLRVAVLQLDVLPDLEENLRTAARLAEEAAGAPHHAKLVCLPECFTGTYGPAHFAKYCERLGEAGTGSGLLRELALRLGVWTLGGVVEKEVLEKEVDEELHGVLARRNEQEVAEQEGREGKKKGPTSERAPLLYNTTVVYDPTGALVARYRKVHLSRVRVGPDATAEATVFQKGGELVTFGIPVDCSISEETRTNGGGPARPSDHDSEDSTMTFGLGCCFDLRFVEFGLAYTRHGRDDRLSPTRSKKNADSSQASVVTGACVVEQDHEKELLDAPSATASTREDCSVDGPLLCGATVDALIYPSAFLNSTGLAHWELLLRARAVDLQIYTIGPNHACKEGEDGGRSGQDLCDALQTPLCFGESLIADPWGEVVARCSREKSMICVAEMTKTKIRDIRERIPLAAERRPEVYSSSSG